MNTENVNFISANVAYACMTPWNNFSLFLFKRSARTETNNVTWMKGMSCYNYFPESIRQWSSKWYSILFFKSWRLLSLTKKKEDKLSFKSNTTVPWRLIRSAVFVLVCTKVGQENHFGLLSLSCLPNLQGEGESNLRECSKTENRFVKIG